MLLVSNSDELHSGHCANSTSEVVDGPTGSEHKSHARPTRTMAPSTMPSKWEKTVSLQKHFKIQEHSKSSIVMWQVIEALSGRERGSLHAKSCT